MVNVNKKELHQLFINIKQNKNNFNEFYEKSNNLVYSIAFSILKNKDDSEDVMQKVFIKIWNINKDCLPSCNEATWLYSVTKNETLNYIRRKKPTLTLDDIYSIGYEASEINTIIEKDVFNKLIHNLNETDKEIISLRILGNLSFKEISQVLNMPIGTIQWKYYKNIKTLRTLVNNLSLLIIISSLFIKSLFNKKNNLPNSVDEINENIINLNCIDYIVLILIIIIAIFAIFSLIKFVKFQQKLKLKVSKR